MKLNIGCGYEYLQGWVNIDSGRDSLADRFMEAHRLEFDDGSAEEIRAAQLIEHLGFFKAKYFLAECYRVLKDGGLLTLETPHVEKTFKSFLKGDRAAREAALGWVYGGETPGMEHRWCFPEELLGELLEGAGFRLKIKKAFEYQPHRPALSLSARKKSGPAADFEAAFRRELAAGDTALFQDEYAASETEKLLKAALSPAIFDDNERVFELALYEPRLAEAFFRVRGPEKYMKAAAGLGKGNFTARIYAALAAQPLESGQKAAFDAALRAGRGCLKEALAGRLPAAVKPGPHPLFSLEMARLLSVRAFRTGLKFYESGNFGEAAKHFAGALRLDRDNPFTWLYLARGFEASGSHGRCVLAYEKALALFGRTGFAGELAEGVRARLEKLRHLGR